ncbi:uncharacterized protein LOC106669118 isoform X3 [Cimex lectularius]|uniref:Secreted protein n=1 Tax=Cimex lectularius TaxID=79782 RepID=A0A8I6S146_CIMLE|nr:uncharacterized protein LOC106669118 isoform X3 [Cimex lectularius]
MKVVQLTVALVICLSATQQTTAVQAVDHFKRWFVTKIQTMSGAVSKESDAEKHLAQARSQLEALKKIAPTKCITEAVHKLSQVRQTTFDDFFHCPNATDVAKNLQQLVCKTLDYGVEVFQTFSTVLLGVNKCLPLSKEDDFKCMSEYFWTVYDLLCKLVGNGMEYKDKVMELGREVREEVDACMHPGNNTIGNQVQQVMRGFTSCVLA